MGKNKGFETVHSRRATAGSGGAATAGVGMLGLGQVSWTHQELGKGSPQRFLEQGGGCVE